MVTRRSFLGVLAAAVGLRLKPNATYVGTDWATTPDYSVLRLSAHDAVFLESQQVRYDDIVRAVHALDAHYLRP